MFDLFFFLKTFVVTILVVFVLQISVGEQRLEDHLKSTIQTSILLTPLNDAARGAGAMARDLLKSLSDRVHRSIGVARDRAGSRFNFQWERHQKKGDAKPKAAD